MEKVRIQCKYALSGATRAEVLYSNDPFSFWGGVERETGIVTDKRHGNFGVSMSGKIFVFPFGKGSSGAGTTLMEMVRQGTAPAAMVNITTDPVLLTGPLIAAHFYDKMIPVVDLSEEDYKKLETAKEVEFFADADYIDVYY
ncbi:DUF126 domain-containing protein [Bengtsoniella intestinalis]|uniref:aconitase X swivel domain-containing protein n=2 Tax=Bengtsoniella intestinalis TaxID=3073143 RepID=UPI00391FA825